MKRAYGFTIVELLIVIVVIAILAAISIVAYTGIQNSANDSAVKSDLANFAKKIQMIQAESGAYPAGGSVRFDADSHTGSVVAPPDGVTFPIATSSYYEPSGSGSVNFIYCTGPSVESGAPVFNVAARSKSGDSFRYNFTKGLEPISVVAVSVACDGIDLPRSMSYGYFSNSGGWQDWVL